MLDRTLRLLIAEKEYFIAIDAGDIVAGLLPCEVTIAMMSELEAKVATGPWDLVLIDVAGDPDADRRNANLVLATGAGLVFLTGYTDLAHGVPGVAEWPVVIKPFTSAELLGAVLRALSLVGKV